MNALFRLTPICSGCIVVDGLDITDVPVRDLRPRFAVVPQSPFLFEGSLRYSLTDPLSWYKVLDHVLLSYLLKSAAVIL